MPTGRPLDQGAILHGADIDALYETMFDAYLFETGGESVYSRDINQGNGSPSSTSRLVLNGFRCKRSETITKATLKTGSTAAGATPTLVRYGLYLRRPDQINYDLVASTPNDTALLAAANTAYPKSFSAPYTKLRGEEYLFGLLIVTAAAYPTFLGPISTLVAPGFNDGIKTPIRQGVIGSQSDLPSTFSTATVGAISPGLGLSIYLEP